MDSISLVVVAALREPTSRLQSSGAVLLTRCYGCSFDAGRPEANCWWFGIRTRCRRCDRLHGEIVASFIIIVFLFFFSLGTPPLGRREISFSCFSCYFFQEDDEKLPRRMAAQSSWSSDDELASRSVTGWRRMDPHRIAAACMTRREDCSRPPRRLGAHFHREFLHFLCTTHWATQFFTERWGCCANREVRLPEERQPGYCIGRPGSELQVWVRTIRSWAT